MAKRSVHASGDQHTTFSDTVDSSRTGRRAYEPSVAPRHRVAGIRFIGGNVMAVDDLSWDYTPKHDKPGRRTLVIEETSLPDGIVSINFYERRAGSRRSRAASHSGPVLRVGACVLDHLCTHANPQLLIKVSSLRFGLPIEQVLAMESARHRQAKPWEPCPCGLGVPYRDCCKALFHNMSPPPRPTRLWLP